MPGCGLLFPMEVAPQSRYALATTRGGTSPALPSRSLRPPAWDRPGLRLRPVSSRAAYEPTEAVAVSRETLSAHVRRCRDLFLFVPCVDSCACGALPQALCSRERWCCAAAELSPADIRALNDLYNACGCVRSRRCITDERKPPLWSPQSCAIQSASTPVAIHEPERPGLSIVHYR